jgi:diketogulonate reductase-like aldo/keto reductase
MDFIDLISKRIQKSKKQQMLIPFGTTSIASSWMINTPVHAQLATDISHPMKRSLPIPTMPFRVVEAAEQAQSLTDGVILSSSSLSVSEQDSVVMPWIGYGTYRLGKDKAYEPTLNALKAGYRCIDTAFIYAGEHTERQVGDAIQTAIQENILNGRNDVFVITKHWRKYHGYDETLKCLKLSLKRLQLDCVDLYLMHWPGPAYDTMFRSPAVLAERGPWAYACTPATEMANVRAETWRAMEDAMTGQGQQQKQQLTRAIGVSNFTIQHLQTLKKTARIWPPAVNQVECHPLYPNNELRDYCQKEGIVLQAYAALGGQDGTKQKWKELLNGKKLLECPVVLQISKELSATDASGSATAGRTTTITPAQVLLRYALQRNCAITPKTTSVERMKENANLFHFQLSKQQMKLLDDLQAPGDAGRLCWRTDPLRMLDFE